MEQRFVTRIRSIAALIALGSMWIAAGASAQTSNQPESTRHLRIVGGLAGVNQYTRHEEPFWTKTLTRLTQGRVTAEIVPFDRAGIRAQEMLRLVQLGVVPFGTALLSPIATQDPELASADLPILNPDMATLRRSLAVARPHLQTILLERYGAELLAVYAYPAQVLFCTKPFNGLADLAGRRIRTSSVLHSDFVEALKATPVQTAFAEIMPRITAGAVDCAITGTMSGNTIGLQEHTSHLHSMPISWGLSIFLVNAEAWKLLPEPLKVLLAQELPKLERDIWAEAERETGEGVACNTGAAACVTGRKGKMIEVRMSPADEKVRYDALESVVLARWARRCGESCVANWNRTVGVAAGIQARTH